MKNITPILIVFIICLLIHSKLYSQTTNPDPGHEQWEYALEGTGDVLQIALPVSAGIISLVKKDYQGTKQFAYSYGTTLALTYSLKYLTKKKRPEGRNRFDSFPSGHTSSAFSGAAFLQRRYGWNYGIPAYILAGIVGISRMEGPDDYHDIWDVLGGAAIGIGSVYIFTKPYEKPKMELSLISSTEYKVLALKYRF